MRKNFIIDLIALLLGLLITSFVTAIPVKEHSAEWFILKIFQFVIVSVIVSEIGRFLFIPPFKFPKVPERMSVFDDGIIESKYNFCSTSAKEIALWESPTFSYYLNLNTVRMISEKVKGSAEINFSTAPQDKQMFYEEGRRLVRDYANRRVTNVLSKFNAIRFLIYPEEVHREKGKEIESLVSIQAVGSIHCIPIIRERLLSRLTEVEKQRLQELSDRLSQKIEDEYTLVSRWDKLMLKIKKENNPYSCSIPDFLIIDAYGKSPKSSVWWYRGNVPDHSVDETLIGLAEECFRIIAKVVSDSWDSVIWAKYHPDILTRVPVFIKMPVMVTFFSKKYYEEWINKIVPKSQKLNEWIKEEGKILKKLVKKNKITRALDIGCGWGRQMEILLKEGVEFCAGVDTEPSQIQKAKEKLYEKFGSERVRLEFENGAELASFKDDYFDVVICTTNTFGNMQPEERKKVIKQAYRVLKRDGIFMLSVYANTNSAKQLREESYKEVGLRPYPSGDPTVIMTQEGLYSKQFNWEEIEKYLKEFRKIEKTDVNDIAFIVIARK